MPVAKTLWGGTSAQIRDPFGVTRAMNQQPRAEALRVETDVD